MSTSDPLPLAVIGAGPKAAALAAKSYALRKCGFVSPQIVIIDRHKVAANWDGRHGYTSGSQRLGTPPEKDIGFPYSIDSCRPEVVQNLIRDFSWISYLIVKGEYGNWIDKGRPHPKHSEWANYLSWVIGKSSAKVVFGDLKELREEDDGWELEVQKKQGENEKFRVGGVVITGPGPSKRPLIKVPEHERILFGDNFWQHLHVLNTLRRGEDEPPVVVVGGGETAASIVSYLVDILPDDCAIVVLTRTGTIFSRGEGYYENRMFTQNETWKDLPKTIKLEIIQRSDRGVFSVDTVRKIALAKNVIHQTLEVRNLEISQLDHSLVSINGKLECQLLVFALGFDTCWFKKHLGEKLQPLFNDPKSAESKIGPDLSVIDSSLKSKLYLPMLAGLEQGPGYPNLSCLGSLSDRILNSYIAKS